MKKTVLTLAILVTSCAYPNVQQDHVDARSMAQEDRKKIYAESLQLPLSVEGAIGHALKHNLDAQIARLNVFNELSVAQLQKLNSLPDIKAQRDYIERSNNGASSSQSVLTGRESLEPSFSSDRSRMTDLLEANWDVLDAAINIYKSKSASDKAQISKERLVKVEQNIAMDVYSSFWRAAIAQQLSPDVQQAVDTADDMLGRVAKAKAMGDIALDKATSIQTSLIDKKEELRSLQHQMSLAEIELKALISFPPSTEMVLKVGDDWGQPKTISRPTGGVGNYVDIALQSRPEVKEEFYNKKIARRAVMNSILDTIPGFTIIAALNEDDNSFLQEKDWSSFTATVSQSITKLLTLPFRYDQARDEEAVGEAKRHALIAAVISQVYISKSVFDQDYKAYTSAYEKHQLQKSSYEISKLSKEVGALSGVAAADSHLDYLIAKINFYKTYADTQASLANFVNTVGYDVRKYYNIAGSAGHVGS